MCLTILCELYRCWDCDQLYLVSYEVIVPNKHHEPNANDLACYCNDNVTWYADTSETSDNDIFDNTTGQHVDLEVDDEGMCQRCHHLGLDDNQVEIDNRRALGFWEPKEMLADMGNATVNADGSIILEVGKHLIQDPLKATTVLDDDHDWYVLIVRKAARLDTLAKFLINSKKDKPRWTTIDGGRCWVTQDKDFIEDVQLELTPGRIKEEIESDEGEESEHSGQMEIDDDDEEELHEDEQFEEGEEEDHGNDDLVMEDHHYSGYHRS